MTERQPATMTARMREYLQRHPKVGIGLVAGSAVVLVAVAAAIIGQLRPNAAGIDGSPSPSVPGSPTASQTQGASPSAPASQATWDGYQLTDVGTPLFGSIWARVTVDELNVRAAPGTDAAVVAVVRRGDLVQVTGDGDFVEERSWQPIVGNGFAGWVAEGDDDGAYLQAVGTPWLFKPQRELALVAGRDSLLAYGWASDLVVPPYEGNGRNPLTYLSTNGTTWNEVTGPVMPVAAAAGGDGGFVVATVPNYLGPYTVQLSTDGETWAEYAVIDLQPTSAAWGPAGPIVVGLVYDDDGFTGGVAAVRVDPGGAVQSLPLPGAGLGLTELEAAESGYVLFSRGSLDLVVSADGTAWTTERVPGAVEGAGMVRDVELVGNQLIVVTTSTETGRTTLHHARLAADGLTWATTTAAPFGRATVDSVSAGGGSMLALGWDQDELLPRVWRSTDGRSWTDMGVDAGTFGGAIGSEPVWADGRWFAMTDGVYASTDGATWEKVFEAPTPEVQGPGCPPPDVVTALDLLFLGPAAADCYGDTPLTVTVWSPLVDGLGGCCPQQGVPEWLAAWVAPAFVSPGPGGFSGSFGVYPAPDVDGAFVTETWARVTGHFHDPEAQDCRHIPRQDVPHRLESPTSVVADCAARFVVDQIVPIAP
ncbi:MAG TPA: SH3 domain-containing protein [Candidatus Limnocylindria bacterium]|nr:SH3 domain-containing protein [Candidatus Limnocylindria bacterium]